MARFRYRKSTSFYGDIEGHWLPNSPRHRLAWHARPDLTLGLGSDTYSRWYVDPGNATSVDGHTS